MKTKRIGWVDSLKGFGILLVILGHISTSNILFFNFDPVLLKNYIFSFHMPLFFFISGFLFNSKKWLPMPKKFLESRVNQILVPYLNFTVIAILFMALVRVLFNHHHVFLDLSLDEMFYNTIFAHYEKIINGHLWFLPALFITEMLYFLCVKLLKNKYLVGVAVLSLAAVGAHYSSLTLPWHLNSALFALLFYASGKAFQKKQDTLLDCGLWTPALITCIHYSLAFSAKYDLQLRAFGNEYLCYLTAMSGILFYSYVFYTLEKYGAGMHPLQWFGKNSIIILSTHGILFLLIKLLTGISSGDELFFITVLLEIPTIKLINKYTPWVIGKPFKISGLILKFRKNSISALK